MTTQAEPTPAPEPRIPLSRERVMRAAITVADRGGIESLTMRRLAEELGAEAMSLYYHVANKGEVLNGVVEAIAHEINDVVDAIEAPSAGPQWKSAARQRILAAREVFLRHPWALRIVEGRTNSSPAVLLYHDRLIGIMRDGGFSYDLIHHSLHALGSRALGFTQELFDPATDDGQADRSPEDIAAMVDSLPHLVGMLAEVAHDDPGSTLGWCDDQTEFEFGLDVILDGLERMRVSASA
jgi:AcrR family transcriptional regulator